MWQEFFSQAYKLPLLVLKRGMANPMGIFIYGILSKWYIMMMIGVIVVTFWVFKGLEKAGVLQAMEEEVRYGLLQAQAVAQNCVPKIVNLPEMWDCIQKTSGADYMPNDDEKTLRKALEHDVVNMQNEAATGRAYEDNGGAPRVQYESPAAGNNPYEDSSSSLQADDGLVHANP